MREWEERADAGDGHYAIAVSLLSVASALRALGTGNAATEMGAIEFLAKAIEDGLGGVASRLDGMADKIGELKE